MKHGLLLFLFICAMCVMALRISRAQANRTCNHNTPCAWSICKPNFPDIILENVTNKYCSCDSDSSCLVHERDDLVNTLVYKCKKKESEELKRNTSESDMMSN